MTERLWLTVETIEQLIQDPPSVYDDLELGIRTLSGQLWTHNALSDDTRARMKEWIRAAISLMQTAEWTEEP